MSQSKPLANPVNVEYLYDGSLPGLYCCVYESVYEKEIPLDILAEADAPPSLLERRLILTDMEKAKRVRASIPKKISARAMELIETVFLSCLEKKEMAILRFLLFAYRHGKNAADMWHHPLVDPLIKAEKHLLGERHLLLGFIRFSDYDGFLFSTITPKNYILPFLKTHFINRFSNENFMIYDKTHGAALIYENRNWSIVSLENADIREPSEEEQSYRALWKQFYNTIAIEARTNHKCRMTHMPKRYWENMLEVKDLL
ncbi:TIGR03915 family putative DNA repair protein [Eubacteriales bacterium OttesenSCG-928-K08]|nr:TIGR03915 family putative DNA repair protein [Eubacteriales bacterium OttesenSCG-928-K08]